MCELTPTQISNIEFEVKKAQVSYAHLQHDLIDHFCCMVEEEILSGLSFDEAFGKVRNQMGTSTLQKVEADTLLLIDKKLRMMKKTMKISGLISMILVSIGSLFKILHWPGAGILIVLGVFALCALFIPSTIYTIHKEWKYKGSVWINALVLLSLIGINVGVLFQVQHYPGSGLIIFITFLLIAVFLLPSLAYRHINNIAHKKLKLPLIFGYVSSEIFITGFVFKLMHWPGASIFLISGSILIISIFLPYYSYVAFKINKLNVNHFIYLTIALAYVSLLSLSMIVNERNKVDNYFYYELIRNRNQLDKIDAINKDIDLEDIKHRGVVIRISEAKKKIIDRVDNYYSLIEENNHEMLSLIDNGCNSILINEIEKYKELITPVINDFEPEAQKLIKIHLNNSLNINTDFFDKTIKEASKLKQFLLLSRIRKTLLIIEYELLLSLNKKSQLSYSITN